jgi:hypothetical protein
MADEPKVRGDTSLVFGLLVTFGFLFGFIFLTTVFIVVFTSVDAWVHH